MDRYPRQDCIPSVESQVVLLLARGGFTAELQHKAHTLLTREPDWSRILRWARKERVFPLIYRNLRTLGFAGVPADARTELRTLVRRNALRSTLLIRELTQVLALLGEARVPVIPLKGVTLAESLYGDPILRACADIDVLVPHNRIAQAFQLLLDKGYRTEFKDGAFADILLRSDVEYVMAREDRGFQYLVELHWGIAWGLLMEERVLKDLWNEAHPKPFLGAPAYQMSPEWQLLSLSAHIARHRWQGLKWLIDIHDLCASQAIDWEKARRKADQLQIEDVLRLTVSACQALFDTPVPKNLLLPSLPRWLKLFPTDPSPMDSLKAALFPIRSFKQTSEKLHYLAHEVFAPATIEHKVVHLPSFLTGFYYLLRPARLACKWGWKLLCYGRGKIRKIPLRRYRQV